MKGYLEVAELAAQQAGSIIQQAAANISALKVEQKSLHDYVSEVDRQAEAAIAKTIHSSFPSHAFIGEEFGLQYAQEGDTHNKYQWIVDPLDGTTNFLRSIPHYAVSIALLIDGELQVAVVYDPVKKDSFTAQKGEGAYLNKLPISVSNSKGLVGGLLATGVPFSGENLAQIDAFTNTMQGLLAKQTSGIRRLGSAALDLAYVACARYDGYWEANLKPWDVAAGILLVTEAGGVVSDLLGEQTQLDSGNILAANPAVHGDMMLVTKEHY